MDEPVRLFKKGERVVVTQLQLTGVIMDVAFQGWKPIYNVKLDDPSSFLDEDDETKIDGAFVRTELVEEAPEDDDEDTEDGG